MYSLKRLILIDSYKPSELIEIRLDGHTNLNGVNGAGKTTLLRLVPLFFGERPGRLVPKSRVTDSFAKHYLPNESSYIIFEYQRGSQTCMALMYASFNEDGLCYRFVDKGFEQDDFIETHRDGSHYPVSCRNLLKHFKARHINCSEQLTACNDYRTVIQNLPHKKGPELRALIARYSFCNSSIGHRLKDIEKIVTGMFMRSTDFADLRDMLVNCIEEDQDAITLELQMETLDSWYKEYRAYQEAEAERGGIAQLNELDNDWSQVQLSLGELQYRLQQLGFQNQQQLQQQQVAAQSVQQQQELLNQTAEQQERLLKTHIADTTTAFAQAQRQKANLDKEKADWDKQSIQEQQQLAAYLPQITVNLQREQANYQQLMADVQDIDAEFKRLQAEKNQFFAEVQHGYEMRIKEWQQQVAESNASAQQATEQRRDTLRVHYQLQQEQLHTEQLDLQTALGALLAKMADIQPDPALIANREAKQEQYHLLAQGLQDAEKAAKAIDMDSKKNQAQIEVVFNDKRQRDEHKQRLQVSLAHLQKQLDADPNTLLGFLREHQPTWIGTIAKVINPDLLLREDLDPTLQAQSADFYGVRLNLQALSADHAADEAKIRVLLLEGQQQVNQLQCDEQRSDDTLQVLSKAAEQLKKQCKAADLQVGQLQKQLQQLTEELNSLKQQIERSKKVRKTLLEQDKTALEAQIKGSNAQLQAIKQQLHTALQQLNEELAAQVQQMRGTALAETQKIQQCISEQQQQKSLELAQLEQQRLQSLQQRKVDTSALTALESSIKQLKAAVTAAELAGQTVKDHQRWLSNEWSRYAALLEEVRTLDAQGVAQQLQLTTEQTHTQQQRQHLKTALARINSQYQKITKEHETIQKLLADLCGYSKRSPEKISFDNAHTVQLLQADYRRLTEQYSVLRKALSVHLRHFKQVLARFPSTHPGRYFTRVEAELGFDCDELAWLSRIQAWYATEADTARSWLLSQARLFGSAIRNYQQALERFDRGIDSLSRRLAAHIDSNIRFEKIERIEGRLTSNVKTLGYWEQIVSFTKNFDDWSRVQDGSLPSAEFADIVRLVSEQLQGKGRVEMKLVNLLELEIMVTENGRSKRATHAEELRQISSHGLSYLILCVFFIALVNMIRKDKSVHIIWPMDELKELHQMNIEVLVDILSKNQITLFSAFPDPDPEVLKLFKNRYQVVGFRELLEMDVDEAYLLEMEPLSIALDAV
ncbi:MAG: ATP-binding protein [Methylococcales bacterium]|nr:ATP-binding protein [Methylococcales bacterium]